MESTPLSLTLPTDCGECGVKVGGREKLQVKGRGAGRGTRVMRGAIPPAEGVEGSVVDVRGRGTPARGRRGRGRGRGREKGRGGRGKTGEGVVEEENDRKPGFIDGTKQGLVNEGRDEPEDDIPMQPREKSTGNLDPGGEHVFVNEDSDEPGDDIPRHFRETYTFDHPGGMRGAQVRGTPEFEETDEVNQWLSEITIVRNWNFDGHWATRSPKVLLAFDDSKPQNQESGPSITLPLFKSAMIVNSAGTPKGIQQPCNDVVLYGGGPIWALDWCPQRPGWVHSGNKKLEFLAVGAHPSAVPYNRLGKPLSGRGLLQIWVFDFSAVEELNCEAGIHLNNKSWNKQTGLGSAGNKSIGISTPSSGGRSGSGRGSELSSSDVATANFQGDLLLLEDTPTGHNVLSIVSHYNFDNAGEILAYCDPAAHTHPSAKKMKDCARARGSDTPAIETNFPQWKTENHAAEMVLGLVHEGLVTWDAKWQPVGQVESPVKERELLRLGFLAVLLGDGSIQVFDVPLPSMLTMHCRKGGVPSDDPLTVHIGPVFRCSELRSGGHKSIPLAVEWSTWNPHDLILVGFHDATVGLWKFSSNKKQSETQPLMFFTADTLPLRSVAWAPDGSGSSGRHMFITAGHSGWVKFWDLRDPFRPIWDLQVSRGCIHSLDWLPWPRCLFMTLDDGTLRILGLDNASSQTPVTGEPWRGTHSQGLRCYLCSSVPIWDVRVSRSTGLVAYAGASGSVLQFQLTEKAIIKEGARSREPHYLCGAFQAESEDGPLTLTLPKLTAPAQMKKSSTEWSSTPRTKRGFLATCTLDNESRQGLSGSTNAVIDPPSTTEHNPGARKRKKHSKAIGKIRSKDLGTSSSYQSNQFESDPLADDSLVLVAVDGFSGEHDLPRTNKLRETSSPPAAENFAPRKVSVHRLRWNNNQNRQHWLAYGGAAGIIRCQKVFSMKKE